MLEYSPNSGHALLVKIEFVQFQRGYIGGQYFAVLRIEGAAILSWQGRGVILVWRIDDGAPGVHNAGHAASADIQVFRVYKPEGMPIFVGGSSRVCKRFASLK